MSVYRFKSPNSSVKNDFKYLSSMHYYNRDLSPVKEIGQSFTKTTSPYVANSQEYEGNIVNKAFKDDMI